MTLTLKIINSLWLSPLAVIFKYNVVGNSTSLHYHMKQIIILLLVLVPFFANAQLGISYHQSNLPFVGFNYDMKNKLRPEIRLGTDQYFYAMSIEGVLTYDIAKKEDYELYAGLGVRVNGFTGVVIPLGLNFYPLTTKQFGFHIELSPIVGEESLLRGSWGIRYRFNKKGT
jgi:hypothetical protein